MNKDYRLKGRTTRYRCVIELDLDWPSEWAVTPEGMLDAALCERCGTENEKILSYTRVEPVTEGGAT